MGKHETAAWIEKEAQAQRSLASYAADRARRNKDARQVFLLSIIYRDTAASSTGKAGEEEGEEDEGEEEKDEEEAEGAEEEEGEEEAEACMSEGDDKGTFKAQKRTRAALRKGCEDMSEPRSPESLPEKKKGKGRGRGGRGKAKMKRPAAAHAPEPPAKKSKTGKGKEKEAENEEEAGQEDESTMEGQSTSKASKNKKKGKQPGRNKEEPQEEEQENPEQEEQEEEEHENPEEEDQEEQQEEEQENPEEEEEQAEEDVGTRPKLEPQVERALKEMRAIAAKDKRFLIAEQEILNGSRSWTLANDASKCKIGVRFQFGSGNFYITGLRKEILDKVNEQNLCDHKFEINRKNTLTVGWSKFPNMQKAWEFSVRVAEW
ncbi:unnamed protein product [Symbiodinium sp. CCMP2592]|nr:unnamed protein product [Symbiodinium sp. CCMP2592]